MVVRQREKFRAWILRHDEKQREEIARLQAQLSTERSILYNAPVWEEMGECPPDTVIGIRYEQLIEWHDEIASLRQQLATAKKALKHYANEHNWRDDGEWNWIWRQNEVDNSISDPVEYANCALKEIGD